MSAKTILLFTEPSRDVAPGSMSVPRMRLVIDCLRTYAPLLNSSGKYLDLIKELESELALLPNGVIDYKVRP